MPLFGLGTWNFGAFFDEPSAPGAFKVRNARQMMNTIKCENSRPKGKPQAEREANFVFIFGGKVGFYGVQLFGDTNTKKEGNLRILKPTEIRCQNPKEDVPHPSEGSGVV